MILGAAAATKYSGLFWIPVTARRDRREARSWSKARASRATARGARSRRAIAAALAGWVYARNFALAGDPLVWNLNVEAGRTWWQLPGFHTADYFLRFGDVARRAVVRELLLLLGLALLDALGRRPAERRGGPARRDGALEPRSDGRGLRCSRSRRPGFSPRAGSRRCGARSAGPTWAGGWRPRSSPSFRWSSSRRS